jgi:cation:H+ antiporter
MYLDILIVLACIVGLWQGAVWLVDSAARIANRMGISELVIGLTVVAIGTSAPEFAVSVSAAIKGQADISVGNVVGSNIFNLGIILGIVALFSRVTTPRLVCIRDGGMLLLAAAFLLVFMSDHTLARWEGAVLLLTLAGYITYLLVRKQSIEDDLPVGAFHWYDIPLVIVGIVTVIVSGHYLVEHSVNIARTLGLSEWIIGVTIVAIGTSSPEVATSLTAVVKGRHGISLGNLIGSDLFNLLGVLGVAALLRPLHVTPDAYTSVAVMGVYFVILVITMRTSWAISRGEAVLLLALTLARWAMTMF